MEPTFQILMVEDVARYQKLYESAIVEALPCRIDFASDGLEALSKLESAPQTDLLILDFHLPKLSGEEVLKKLRQDPRFDNMPVIILTGESSADIQERLLGLGADDFVEKGAAPEIFLARLKAQMRHRMTLDRLTKVMADMDMFAAGVMHDIRNLESSITAICQLTTIQVEEDPVANKAAVLDNMKSLVEQTGKLSDYATTIIKRTRETNSPLNLESVDLGPLLAWTTEVVAKTIPKSESGFSSTVPGPLSPVIADRDYLRLALLNIMQNSVKYRKPAIPLSITVFQEQPESSIGGQRKIVTKIRDNGTGVKPDELREIFKPFVRGRRKSNTSGFGLGLSLVEKVITKIGGRVWAEIPTDGNGGVVMCVELAAG